MDFLFEMGLEEVPARMIAGAQAELAKRTLAMMNRERLVSSDVTVQSFSTPRRLAIMVGGVRERQEDVADELMGPAVKIAYKDGVAGPAALAFAKKAGVEISALKIVTTAKGEYVAATSVKAGRSAAEVLAAELPKELAGIYWAKNMYWRAGKPERFVRPVRWIVALLNHEVVPVSFGGHEAGRVTYGHRILHGSGPVVVTAREYAAQLRAAFVESNVEERKHTIRKALDRICRATGEGLRWREDHGLVDKMTHMTEWPSVIAGSFDPEYLKLPEEVLVTVMRDHQNYFAVETQDGKLAPHFLAVLNTVADEAGEALIRHGNERVLRARFNDAKFFWDFDQRVPLAERVALLDKVTFQKDLGSYGAKSLRVCGLCETLSEPVRAGGVPIDEDALLEAARLAKADLTTELVREFTELQGEVGGLYARTQGVSETAAAAIYDQYHPTSMEDRIPRTVEGQVLAIADKADTIAGMFGLGLIPKGSSDPFALRRAGNGIVKILAESELPVQLGALVRISSAQGSAAEQMMHFFRERLEFYLREARGQAYDVVNAVLAVGSDDVRDAVARTEAVTAVRGSEDFKAISAAFKRIANILEQAADQGDVATGKLKAELFTAGPERSLAEASARLAPEVEGLCAERNYAGALEAIATLRPQVDAFFEAVMVMDPDTTVRTNRLALLAGILKDFGGIADFLEIVTAG